MYHTISTHTDQLEAHIVKGRLEAEGIPVFIAFEHHVSGDWLISQAIGGVRVHCQHRWITHDKRPYSLSMLFVIITTTFLIVFAISAAIVTISIPLN